MGCAKAGRGVGGKSFAKCQRQDVRFFFKQWGGTRKKLNGRLEWQNL